MPKQPFTDRRDDTEHQESCRRNGVPYCSPRRSGVSRLATTLLGQGFTRSYRLMNRARAEAWADSRDAKKQAN